MIDFTEMAKVLIDSFIVFVSLVLLLRIAGKRTTSKMNSFDWVITVALGSMTAAIIIQPDITLAQGLSGLLSLVIIQYIVAWLNTRSSRFQRIIKATPQLLYYRGNLLTTEMKRERITNAELLAAIRSQGYQSFDEIRAIVLETNSDISIVKKSDSRTVNEATLENVMGHSEHQINT